MNSDIIVRLCYSSNGEMLDDIGELGERLQDLAYDIICKLTYEWIHNNQDSRSRICDELSKYFSRETRCNIICRTIATQTVFYSWNSLVLLHLEVNSDQVASFARYSKAEIDEIFSGL